MQFATLTDTILDRADLSGAYVYGISAWNLGLEGTTQTNRTITYQNCTPGLMPIRELEPVVTAENILIAQFLYLLLNNENFRQIIDTITSKTVLILGRFSAERKTILDAIRDALRQMNYLPVVFDFNAPTSRDFTETIRTLAHLARFIVVDLTEARSVPQELQAIVPHLAVPVQPLLLASEHEYAVFSDLKRKYHWVLETHRYDENESLLVTLRESLVQRAERKAQELADGMQKGRQ